MARRRPLVTEIPAERIPTDLMDWVVGFVDCPGLVFLDSALRHETPRPLFLHRRRPDPPAGRPRETRRRSTARPSPGSPFDAVARSAGALSARAGSGPAALPDRLGRAVRLRPAPSHRIRAGRIAAATTVSRISSSAGTTWWSRSITASTAPSSSPAASGPRRARHGRWRRLDRPGALRGARLGDRAGAGSQRRPVSPRACAGPSTTSRPATSIRPTSPSASRRSSRRASTRLALYDELRPRKIRRPSPPSSISATTALLSSSPERFLKLEAGVIETRPIKGTRPRGRQPGARRRRSAAELLASEKDRGREPDDRRSAAQRSGPGGEAGLGPGAGADRAREPTRRCIIWSRW